MTFDVMRVWEGFWHETLIWAVNLGKEVNPP